MEAGFGSPAAKLVCHTDFTDYTDFAPAALVRCSFYFLLFIRCIAFRGGAHRKMSLICVVCVICVTLLFCAAKLFLWFLCDALSTQGLSDRLQRIAGSNGLISRIRFYWGQKGMDTILFLPASARKTEKGVPGIPEPGSAL